MNIQYKARIDFRQVVDDYEQGELDGYMRWETTLTARTSQGLRTLVLAETYSAWEDLDDDQMNDYDWCTEYQTSYQADKDGVPPSAEDRELWKAGKLELYAVRCHIFVTRIVESKGKL